MSDQLDKQITILAMPIAMPIIFFILGLAVRDAKTLKSLGRTAMGRLMWAIAISIVPHAILFAILCCAIGEIWAIFVGIPFFYFGIRSKWRLPKPSKSGASR